MTDPAPPAEPTARRRRKALGVALGCTLVSVALAFVPLPNARAILSHLAPTLWPHVGVLAIGLTPLLAGFQIVELVAAAVPRWRPLRIGGAAARRPLDRAALVVGGALAAAQSLSIVVWIESNAASWHGAAARISVGWSSRLAGIAVLLGGLALLVLFAAVIRRYGLGEGYSWILLGSLAPSLANAVVGAGHHVVVGQRKPIALLAEVLLLAALFVASRRYLRDSAARAEANPVRPLEPTAGILPPSWSAQLLLLPMTLSSLFGLDLARVGLASLAARLTPGTPLYAGLCTALTAVVSLALSRAFFRSENVARGFADIGAPFDRASDGAAFAAQRRAATKRTTLVLCALVAADGYAVARLLGASTVSLIAVVFVAAIVEDIADEWRGRRLLGGAEEPLIALARLYQIAPARARLRAADIDCFVRGAHHRTLLSFFGPFIPVTIFVRAADVARARELLQPESAEQVGRTERGEAIEIAG